MTGKPHPAGHYDNEEALAAALGVEPEVFDHYFVKGEYTHPVGDPIEGAEQPEKPTGVGKTIEPLQENQKPVAGVVRGGGGNT